MVAEFWIYWIFWVQSLLIGIRDVFRIPASVDFFKAKIVLTPIARSSQITKVQKQSSSYSVRKGILRNFAKFTGKYLCQSLIFNKVAGLRPATLLKKRLAQVFSCEFCEIFKNNFFYGTTTVATSDSSLPVIRTGGYLNLPLILGDFHFPWFFLNKLLQISTRYSNLQLFEILFVRSDFLFPSD